MRHGIFKPKKTKTRKEAGKGAHIPPLHRTSCDGSQPVNVPVEVPVDLWRAVGRQLLNPSGGLVELVPHGGELGNEVGDYGVKGLACVVHDGYGVVETANLLFGHK